MRGLDPQEQLLRETQHALKEMSERLNAIEARLTRLEGGEPAPEEPAPPIETVAPVAPPEPEAPSVQRIPLPPPPPPPAPDAPEPAPEPAPTPEPVPAARPAIGLEEIIGGRWALWIGVLLMLIAVGFGLAYGWDRLPPIARIAIGAVSGIAIIAASEVLRGRSSRWFLDGVAAIGAGVLYLTVWGAQQRYGIVTGPAGLR